MRRIFTAFVMVILLGSLVEPASAQWCGDECVGVDIDAQLGFEALQEPVEGTTETTGRAEAETNGYIGLNAAVQFQLYNFQTVMQAPLRFSTDGFRLREADWDETEDYLRIFRCVRLDFMSVSEAGRDDWDPVRYTEWGDCVSWTPTEAAGDVFRETYDFTYYSLRMRPLRQFTLGTGTLVSGYSATLEEDTYREGITTEINLNRVFVLTAGLSDIIDPTVAAARMVVRPVNTRTAGGYGYEPSKELYVEIGVTGAADFRAPTIGSTGLYSEERFYAGGADARLRWSSVDDYSRESYKIMRFELGAAWNQLFGRGGGLDAHARFYFDNGPFDMYIDATYEFVGGRYIPSYFNQHYRVQRSQMALSDSQRQALGVGTVLVTKLDYLDALPKQNEHAYAATLRFRFWPWSDEIGGWTRDGADLWFFVQDVPRRELSGRAGVGLTIYNIADKLRIWGEFVQQGWDTIGELFSLQNSVLNLHARYFITEQIYLHFLYEQTWFIFNNGQFDSANNVGISVGFTPGF